MDFWSGINEYVKVKILRLVSETDTAQKMKFSIKDSFSKCDQIRSFLRIWSHLRKKYLMENLIFCAVRRYIFLRTFP